MEPRAESEDGFSYISFIKSENVKNWGHKNMTFPIGRIIEGQLIPFLAADLTEHVNNSTVPLSGQCINTG